VDEEEDEEEEDDYEDDQDDSDSDLSDASRADNMVTAIFDGVWPLFSAVPDEAGAHSRCTQQVQLALW
jgi:hypothetical protein